MKVYEIKKLIDGYKIKPELRGKTLVACKAAAGYTHIKYNDQIMPLYKGPLASLSQQDQFGRGVYFLDYYEWKPLGPEGIWDNIKKVVETDVRL